MWTDDVDVKSPHLFDTAGKDFAGEEKRGGLDVMWWAFLSWDIEDRDEILDIICIVGTLIRLCLTWISSWALALQAGRMDDGIFHHLLQ